ncbi:MAG: hypothetical protein K5888_01620 [Lachnospiraceae bacterium]|nr:hypothetical protein [Lachnospiraceae bacterium]
MSNITYRKEGIDLKRFGLYLQRRIWIIIVLTILGFGVGALTYQIVRSINMPIEYKAVSKLYISFNVDENGDVYQYYNGYTWDELMDADPVMECIMTYLPGYNPAPVREATKAEILSDVRLLTVTVTGNTEKFVREVQAAVQDGLTLYATTTDELRAIYTIRSISPERVYWENKTMVSGISGAIIFGIVTLMAYLFGYVLNETICVQSDLEKRFPIKALGIMTRNQKGLQPYNQELKANLLYLLSEKKSLVFIDIDDHAELRGADMEKILNWKEGGQLGGDGRVSGELVWHVRSEEDEDDWFADEKEKEWKIYPLNESELTDRECEFIRRMGGVIILIPFGVGNASRKTERVLSLLKNQDCNVLGAVISEADEEYLNRYFA